MNTMAAVQTMRRLPRWSSAAIFNVVWFSCVTGNNRFAVVMTVLYLLFHSVTFVQSRQEYGFILCLAGVGIFLDSVLTTLNVIHFSHRIEIGMVSIAPVWMMCLWLCFATTIHHGFHWLHHRLWLASVMVIWSVPSSYYVGARISGSTVDNLWLMLAIYALLWALLFPAALKAAR